MRSVTARAEGAAHMGHNWPSAAAHLRAIVIRLLIRVPPLGIGT